MAHPHNASARLHNNQPPRRLRVARFLLVQEIERLNFVSNRSWYLHVVFVRALSLD